MKWTNKGQQFDKIGKMFENIDKIYIYGAGEYGKELCERIKVGKIEAFIDANSKDIGETYQGIPLISVAKFRDMKITDNYIVIIAASIGNTEAIRKQLVKLGYVYNVNFFSYHDYMNHYYQIYALYRYNYLELHELTFSITNICSLKCKYCSLQIPFQNAKHRSYEQLIYDLKTAFDNIDYLENMAIIGGEPFTYPYLKEYIIHIAKNYSKKIGKIRIVTNGTIDIKDELLQVIKRNNIIIEVTNYLYIGDKNKVDNIKMKCKKNDIIYRENNYENWIDFGLTESNRRNVGNEELEIIFDDCNTLCRGFIDGSLVMCLPGYFSNISSLKLQDNDNIFDFTGSDSKNKKIIYEYDYGFTKSGFLNACQYCNGFHSINKNIIPVGEQMN